MIDVTGTWWYGLDQENQEAGFSPLKKCGDSVAVPF
jgi:hypothetical protein